MGQSNTKPTDVSDVAWLQYQDKKLEMMKEEIQERDRLNKESQTSIYTLMEDYNHYCHACHDVPKAFMMFPSYRNECYQARSKLMNNTANTILNKNLIETKDQIIEKLNHM